MRKTLVLTLLTVLSVIPATAQAVLDYPFSLFSPPPFSPDTVSVLFVGDVMMHTKQIENSLDRETGEHDFSQWLVHVRDRLEKATVAVANMEFTLAGKPYTGYPCFSAPDNYPDYVADCGVDIFLTANNHILDKGRKGIDRTLSIYDSMEKDGRIWYTGAAADEAQYTTRYPLIFVARGVRIALVNFTYGTNLGIQSAYPKVNVTDTTEIAEAIRRAKAAKADFIIALPHWGTEYVLSHSASQHNLAVWLAEQGCDAVVGAHPHVVQDTEVIRVRRKEGYGYKEVPVVYSMGNFISNMSARNTQVGLMVTLKFAKGPEGARKILPPDYSFTWCTRPGTLSETFSTVPVKEFLDKRDMWIQKGDYDNMVRSYERVKAATGITD